MKAPNRIAKKTFVFRPVIAVGSDIREIVRAMFPKHDDKSNWKTLVQTAEMFLIYSGPKLGYAA